MRIFFAILLFASAASGADLCVGPTSSGAANGTTWSDKLGWGFTPVRGNTYYLEDGNYTADKDFNTAVSGSTLITIRKATVAAHGSSTGWSDAMGDGQAVLTDGCNFSTSNWVLDGVSRSSWTNGHGIKITHDGIGIHYPNLCSNITVQYVEIQGHGDDGVQGWESNCHVYSSPNGSSFLVWRYLYMHDTGCQPFMIPNMTDGTIEFCFVARNESVNDDGSGHEQHSEGIYADNTTRMTVRNSIWVDIEGTGVIMLGGSGHNVYNNLIYWTDASRNDSNGSIGGWTGHNLVNSAFHHNTIILPQTSNGANQYGFSGFSSSGTNVAYNNLFYCASSVPQVGIDASITHDYNWFRNVGTFSETHIQNGSGNPFVNSAAFDFSLSSATSSGKVLGAPYNVDINGVARVNYDRGAFEFVSGEPPAPAEPTMLHIGFVETIGTTLKNK